MREVVNAIRHVLRTGCTWRSLPLDFPCWQTVYGYFSRSVKMTEVAGPRDYDAHKPKKVALVAAMHKLLTLLNAMMRDQTAWQPPPQTIQGT